MIAFYPDPGMILMCKYAGYRTPEMVKERRVVVVSPRNRNAALDHVTAIVVPLSRTAPFESMSWHYEIAAGKYPGVANCWAKGDLVSHVGVWRLDRIYHEGDFVVPRLDAPDLAGVRNALKHGCGIT
jgi:uncharacterized protein YifN (PemK superfamily)